MKYPLLLIGLPNLKQDKNWSRQHKPLKQGLRDSQMCLNIYFSYLIAGYAQVNVVLPWGFKCKVVNHDNIFSILEDSSHND